MIFSSTIFLFGFLPIVLLCYAIVPKDWKNVLLLFASLFFYAWGELSFTFLMLLSIFWNYAIGRLIGSIKTRKRTALCLGIGVNLLLLGYFKYGTFLVQNFNAILQSFHLETIHPAPIHLPLGISFFTFQAISYLVDVHRQETQSQKNIITLGLYISMFPQLIAGPIVRYGSVAKQLMSRSVNPALMEQGVLRFVYGLAKKLLIANPLGEMADAIFALPADQLPAQLAWAAILAYSLQIYFDFSGYSDMAIGLGRMFGFDFPENFNYPYAAKNLRDFWRRWHMSLTSWLRDYLYIPLGGSRVPKNRIIFNLFVVFFLCGLWHGASWNFVIWGLWHGFFLVLERGRFGKILNAAPAVFQHLYLLLIVVVGWVFFRSADLTQVFGIGSALIGLQGAASSLYPIELYYAQETLIAAGMGIILAMPLFRVIQERMKNGITGFLCRLSLMSLLLFGSFMKISSGTYNPFLYFRF